MMRASRAMPAAFTTPLMHPVASSARRTVSCTALSFVTSIAAMIGRGAPSAAISFDACASLPASTSTSTTCAPCAASPRAIACPIPDPAPVTMWVSPSNAPSRSHRSMFTSDRCGLARQRGDMLRRPLTPRARSAHAATEIPARARARARSGARGAGAALAEPADEAAALLERARSSRTSSARRRSSRRAPRRTRRASRRASAPRVALTQVMAIRSNGNLPLVDGLQDTDANRALWADLGKRALEHARAAEKLDPQSPAAAAALASSYMFYASSLGIIRSIVSGAGGEYQAHAQRLIDLDPKFDDALGDVAARELLSRGAVAGLRSRRGARALRAAPQSSRPSRCATSTGSPCSGRATATPRARARTSSATVALPCTPRTERLFCDFMKQTAQRELARLAAR